MDEREVLSVFEAAAGEPLTSPEVAEALDCARTTAYKALQGLADAGRLRTKKVGARGRVWWLPPDADEAGDGQDYGDLLASERLLRAVFEGAFDAILVADDEGRYVDANPAAAELFGLAREELLGRSVGEFAAEGYDTEGAWGDFQASELDRGLFPLVDADGEQHVVEFAATRDILPGRHLSVLRDVTERRAAETALERERRRSERYQRTLAADAVIELSFELPDAGGFGGLSERLDCRCEFEGATTARDGRLLQYVTVTGAPGDAVRRAVPALPAVASCRVVFEDGDATLVEVDAPDSPVATLAGAGANARAMHSEGGVTRAVAEVGADADLQGLVNAVTDAHPDATVVAKRTLDRPVVTTRQYRESVADSLTERQAETLRAAYLSGYFEWPRASSAEAVADSTGVATSTWLRHLRRAEATLVGWFLKELDA